MNEFYSVTFDVDCVPHYFKTHGEAYEYAINRCAEEGYELIRENFWQLRDEDEVDDIFYISTCEFESLNKN